MAKLIKALFSRIHDETLTALETTKNQPIVFLLQIFSRNLSFDLAISWSYGDFFLSRHETSSHILLTISI